ncbi:heterokaryon incompatibility protein-domain-containing protein [Paraphoma chrysanthemicola]|nr:heterokaryon incompatibility protein-domain-containing protein [Paraphoma chrysanthemicola]
MSLGLCEVCKGIFEGPLVVSEERPHHESLEGFVDASATCYICRTITRSSQWKELERRASLCESIPPAAWYVATHTLEMAAGKEFTVWYKLTIDHAWDEEEIPPPPVSSEDDLPDLYPETPVWEFRISPFKEVEGTIGDRRVSSSFQDENFLDLPRKWYHDCNDNHHLCKPPDSTFRPTRLMEILDDDATRLVLSSGHVTDEPYISFSHCWGKAKTLKLLQCNMSRLLDKIRIAELPTSYKEAISVCRSMGFRYIWIDSFCIIQDSRSDWQQEALTMKDVYQNSALNLCASAAAENSEASFRLRDPSLISPLQIVPEWAEGETHYISRFDMYDDEISHSPLQSRAWVMQEYFLSHRSISLTHSQLWWQCKQQIACETFPGGYPSGSIDPTRLSIMRAGTERTAATGNRLQFDYEWYRLVEDYSRCGLTVTTDKLIAFAGLAQAFRRFYPNDAYVAGFWRSQLPLALCWSTDSSTVTYRPPEYVAPSWSWASVKGVVVIPLIQDEFCFDGIRMTAPERVLATALDVRIEHSDPRYDTGQVVAAQLDLVCHLIGPLDWKSREAETFDILSESSAQVEFEVTLGDTAVVFDNTSRDEISNMSWWEKRKQSAVAGLDETDAAERWAGTEPPEFLVPIAEYVDYEGKYRTFGIMVYRVEDGPATTYVRSGNFERLILPAGVLEKFPRQTITID